MLLAVDLCESTADDDFSNVTYLFCQYSCNVYFSFCISILDDDDGAD